VRNVVKGQRLPTVSDTLQLTSAALRKWVERFAHQGTRGLKNTSVSCYRPTGRLAPTPADLASGSLDLAARESPARRGALIGF
jgi:hypothetical protein